MRVLTVSELKNPKRNIVHRDYPRAGTLAARVYEKLKAQKGRVVDIGSPPKNEKGQRRVAIMHLVDDYGLDIRKAAGPNKYILAGEWFGAHYSDYVAQAIDHAVASGELA